MRQTVLKGSPCHDVGYMDAERVQIRILGHTSLTLQVVCAVRHTAGKWRRVIPDMSSPVLRVAVRGGAHVSTCAPHRAPCVVRLSLQVQRALCVRL